MSILKFGRLVDIAKIGHSLAEALIFRRFLEGIAVVVTITIVSGMLIGAFIIGALYGCYLLLVHYGLAPEAAVFTIVGGGFLCMILLILFAVHTIRKYFSITRLVRGTEETLTTKFMPVIDAFVAGLTTKPHRPGDKL